MKKGLLISLWIIAAAIIGLSAYSPRFHATAPSQLLNTYKWALLPVLVMVIWAIWLAIKGRKKGDYKSTRNFAGGAVVLLLAIIVFSQVKSLWNDLEEDNASKKLSQRVFTDTSTVKSSSTKLNATPTPVEETDPSEPVYQKQKADQYSVLATNDSLEISHQDQLQIANRRLDSLIAANAEVDSTTERMKNIKLLFDQNNKDVCRINKKIDSLFKVVAKKKEEQKRYEIKVTTSCDCPTQPKNQSSRFTASSKGKRNSNLERRLSGVSNSKNDGAFRRKDGVEMVPVIGPSGKQ